MHLASLRDLFYDCQAQIHVAINTLKALRFSKKLMDINS